MVHAVKQMIAAGAVIIEIDAPRSREFSDASYQVLLYEFKDGINKYFTGLGKDVPVKSLRDLIEFNRKDTIELKYLISKYLLKPKRKAISHHLNTGLH